MACLYLDSARDRLSVGLVSGSRWVTREGIEGRHDEVLLESIRALCAECNLSVGDIDRCVVVNGPGSFTGLRIAVSFIHALDLVTPLKVLPVDQLSLIAEAAQSSNRAILDARMDEVYVGYDRHVDGTFKSLQLKQVAKLSRDETWICHYEEQDRFELELIPVTPTLHTLRSLASQMDLSRWIDGHQLTPRYVRQTVSWKPLTEQPSKLYDIEYAFFLALIQGLTEFLPISSSAHLILPSAVLGWRDQGLAFDVAVHFGSLGAVILSLRIEVQRIATGMVVDWGRRYRRHARLGWLIGLATLPAVISGVLAKDWIDGTLRSELVIAAATIGFGLLLWWAHYQSGRGGLASIGVKEALFIGLAQALALVPGTSRSGITLTAGLWLGLSRPIAAKFSFYYRFQLFWALPF